MQPTSEPPLIQRQAPVKRLSHKLFGGLFLVLVLLGGAWLLWTLNSGPVVDQQRDATIPEDTGVGTLPSASDELHISKRYDYPRGSAPAAAPETPPAQGGTTPMGQRPSKPPPWQAPNPPAMGTSVEVHTGGGTPMDSRTGNAAGGGRQPQQPPGQARQKKGRGKEWVSMTSRYKDEVVGPPVPETPEGQQGQSKTGSKLFPQAVWEEPVDKYKVLYADQIVNVQLQQNVNSDFPGVFRLKATQDTEDRWGHGHVVVPRDTTFMAKPAGDTGYGQERIPASVYMAIYPDGRAVSWNNGQVGDQSGASGMEAQVNNHYFKLLAGVGLQALLNIGTRVPFGSPGVGQVQQNLPQEFAQDATRGVGTAGNRIITQQFQVKPTLTQDMGYPATIQFLENVSFQTDAKTITK